MGIKQIIKRAAFAKKYGETLVMKKDYIFGKPAEGLLRFHGVEDKPATKTK